MSEIVMRYLTRGLAAMKSVGTAAALAAFVGYFTPGNVAWSAQESGAPTFNRDIAPIIFKHCSGCHRPGESAPFSLLTYQDLMKRPKQVADVTQSRFMPPWLPEPGYGDFIGDRRLSDDVISLIRRWVDSGAAEGDPSDLPPPPTWPEGWQLDEPDLVVPMVRPYTLKAEGDDVYRNFVIPIPTTKTRYVEAIELRPGNKRAVHHANILIDPSLSSKILDDRDPGLGFDGMDFYGEAQRPGGYFLTWVPGTLPSVEPTAWRLEPRSFLVLNFHMVPTGKPEPVDPIVGFHFTDKPAQGPLLFIFKLEGDNQGPIPPGERDFQVVDDYTLPVDVEVVGVDAHAHFLGKTMQGFATLPDGTKKWIIRINDWDLNWQDIYRFRRPVFLPKGSIVSMRYIFDNSSDNVRNPNNPPKRVVFGNGAYDEMSHLWVQFKVRDRESLGLLEVGQAEHLLEKYPHDPLAHYNLGRFLQLDGRLDEAIPHYERALHERPEFALAHHNLGSALRRLGRLDAAIEHYKTSVKLRPHYAPSHSFLARTLHEKGQMAEAIRYYRETLKLNPDDLATRYYLTGALRGTGDLDGAEEHLRIVLKVDGRNPAVHHELGATLYEAGRAVEALRHYRRSIELKDDAPMTLARAAWILATHTNDEVRDSAEAVTLAERASELTGHKHPAVEDTLAVAYAAAGDYDRAVATAENALILLSGPGHDKAVHEIQRHLKLFKNRTPLRESRERQNPSSRDAGDG